MVKKSLHHQRDIEELKFRINGLIENSERKWGRMSASQMMVHCARILQIPTGRVVVETPIFLFKIIGILTKHEMRIFGNGIPHNMPTFDAVICEGIYDFTASRTELFVALEDYLELYRSKKLPASHPLFGKMTEEQWGFMEYKHIDHHLKQFGL